MILVAGMPASGKTSFAKRLSSELKIPLITKDEIVEILYDKVGFRSSRKKQALNVSSMEIMFQIAESLMKVKKMMILESCFDKTMQAKLEELINQYSYTPLTLLFEGKTEVLYNRYIERDMSPERHKGHVFTDHYPQRLKSSKIFTKPITFDEFKKITEDRCLKDFLIGNDIIKVDTTDFDKFDIEDIIETVKDKLNINRY
jgi:predicted kinase